MITSTTSFNRLTFLFVSFLLIIYNSGFGQQKVSKDAQDYIDAYINMKFTDVEKFYSDNAIFQDPTLELINPESAKQVVGRKAIMEKLKRNFNGIRMPKYELTNSYAVGNYTIFSGRYSYIQNATAFGGPNVDIKFSLESTTIIKQVEGRVTEHMEYMDYASWFTQFESQTKK